MASTVVRGAIFLRMIAAQRRKKKKERGEK
jgi:hypothetical protein